MCAQTLSYGGRQVLLVGAPSNTGVVRCEQNVVELQRRRKVQERLQQLLGLAEDAAVEDQDALRRRVGGGADRFVPEHA